MATLHADVFMTAVAIGELLVMMFAKEARQGVANARNRAVFRQVVGAAPAPPVIAGRGLEHVIVDVMSPERAREFSQ